MIFASGRPSHHGCLGARLDGHAAAAAASRLARGAQEVVNRTQPGELATRFEPSRGAADSTTATRSC
eukprot:scaffold6843_cov149-Isochrysis_galbana.AAC.9